MNANFAYGHNYHQDEGVILGYRTGRNILITATVIGDQAYILSNTTIFFYLTTY